MRTRLLTPDEAGGLARALGRMAHVGPMADALVDVQHAATEAWATGGEVLVVISSGEKPDSRPDTHRTCLDDDEVLTQEAAANEASVDVRTIRRHLDKGTLTTTHVEGQRRVRRGDLRSLYPNRELL